MAYKYQLKFLLTSKVSSFLFYFFVGLGLFILAIILPWGIASSCFKLLFLAISLTSFRQAYLNTQVIQVNGKVLTQHYLWGKSQAHYFNTENLDKIQNGSALFQAKYAYGLSYTPSDTYSSILIFKDKRKLHLYSTFENYSAFLNYLRLDIENLNEEESNTILDQIKDKIDVIFD